MKVKRAVGTGLVVLLGVAMAQHVAQSSSPRAASSGAIHAAAGSPVNTLIPRVPFAKMPTDQLTVPDRATGRLVVKFHDEIRARAADGRVRSLARYDIRAFRSIIRRHRLSVRPVLSTPPEELAQIEARAAAYSGTAQPDVAGMLYVEGDSGVPMAAAAALNNLDYIEFVEYEPEFTPGQPATGACCQTGGICVVVTFDQCTSAGGVYLGDGTTCGGNCAACCLTTDVCVIVSPDVCAAWPAPDGPGVFLPGEPDCAVVDCSELDEPDCGVAFTGDCFDPNNGSPYCADEQCCLWVCEIDPFCCDDTGEIIWPGRNGTGVGAWDEWCADHALELCAGDCDGGPAPAGPVNDPAAATPSFTDAQGYQTPAAWSAPPPDNIAYALRYDANGTPDLIDGFSGEGFDLQGIWDIGQLLVDVGIAPHNLTRGKSIKVGVIEGQAYVHGGTGRGALGVDGPYRHEDLHGKVVVESDPDQAFLIIPNTESDGNHGTATLGIIGAIDHNAAGNPVQGKSPAESLAEEVGMVGMAPDADLYFFSSTTISGGGVQDAIGRALAAGFGPGDVLSFSIGGGECTTLANSPSAASMLALSTSAGITCCISAGNDNCNLDTNAWVGDTGAIVVGSVFPGAGTFFNQYCRLPYSNYCQTCDVNVHVVHTSAWGTAVATLGYGDLFTGNSINVHNRAYTSTFGGTSAAAPQVASIVACLQGLSKMMWGIPLSPVTMRGLVAGHGFVQCRFQDTEEIPGDSPLPFRPCPAAPWIMSEGDWNRDETANRVADVNVAFSNTFRVAEEVVTGEFFSGNPLVDEIEILVGHHVAGNLFSIKARDNAHLVISSELTNPTGPSVSDRGDIITGYITDVLVRSHTQFGNVNSLTIAAETFVTGGAGVVLCYIYSWDFEQWMVGGVAFLLGLPDENVFFEIGNASQFIHAGDQLVLFRIQTVSAAFGPTYEAFHDFIGLTAGGNPIVPSDG
ncbi:MAG: S8 family serine peptidase [Planctomycetota bacterium]|jgi:hypothetical protein